MLAIKIILALVCAITVYLAIDHYRLIKYIQHMHRSFSDALKAQLDFNRATKNVYMKLYKEIEKWDNIKPTN